ncbi:MAG: hypothetical protein ACK55Z_24465 [bacterium]
MIDNHPNLCRLFDLTAEFIKGAEPTERQRLFRDEARAVAGVLCS